MSSHPLACILTPVQMLKTQVVVAEFAVTLDVKKAGKAAGLMPATAVALLTSPEGVELLNKEIANRLKRIRRTGDQTINDLLDLAETAKSAKDFKTAHACLVSVAEMTGVSHPKQSAVINAQGGQVGIVFGSKS